MHPQVTWGGRNMEYWLCLRSRTTSAPSDWLVRRRGRALLPQWPKFALLSGG